MRFLDANVFLFGALDAGDVGRSARNLLGKVSISRPDATSVLALHEVYWHLQKGGRRSIALAESRRLTGIAGLRVLPVGPTEWANALDLMEKHRKLRPHDALHAATAMAAGIRTIVSTDTDFDGIHGLKRAPLK